MTKINLLKMKKGLLTGLLAGTMVLGPVGCGKSTTEEPTTAAVTTEATTEVPTEALDETVEVNTSAEEYEPGVLNVNVNESIEEFVDKNYEEFKEFYDDIGIDKAQIRNIVLFVNDKYESADGTVTMSEDELGLAYCNVERILLPYKVSQKIDNINSIKNGDISKEEDGINIPKIPKLSEFFDTNIGGSAKSIKEMQEWENELSYQCDKMNKEQDFDVESINKFIKKNEVTDYNNDETGLSSTPVTGFRFVLSQQHNYALKMAGAMQPQVIYIEGNTGIDEIKINFTNPERKVIDLVENLKEENLLDTYKADEVVEYVVGLYSSDQSTTPEEIAAAYDLSIDHSDLLIDEAIALSTIEYYQYERMGCNLKREALDKRNNVANKSKTTSKNNGIKKTYTA